MHNNFKNLKIVEILINDLAELYSIGVLLQKVVLNMKIMFLLTIIYVLILQDNQETKSIVKY